MAIDEFINNGIIGMVKHKKQKTNISLQKISPQVRLSLILYLGALLMGLSFVFSNRGWFIFISVLPLFVYVENLKKLSLKRILIDFFVMGVIVMGSSFLYMFQAASQNWDTVVSGWFVLGSRFIAWFIATIVCATPFIGLAWVLYKIKNDSTRLWATLLLWPIFEIIRAFVFSVISYGKGGAIGIDTNFGSLAVSASDTPLVYISRIFSFWGMSVAVLAFGLGVYYLFKKRFLIGGLLIFSVVVVSVLTYNLPSKNNVSQHKVVVVHLNENDAMSIWENFDSIPENTDLLVLPEYSEATKDEVIQKIANKLSVNGVAITTVTEGKLLNKHNKLVYFNKEGQIVSKQDKSRLIPMGEYLPWVINQAFKLFKQKTLIDTFMYVQMVNKGQAPIRPFNYGGKVFGALPCSGVTAVGDYYNIKRQGADVLINSASLSFLSPNSTYHVYGKNMARYQAVSNNLPYIQSSRSGDSYIIDVNGNTIAQNPSEQTRVITNEVIY